MLDFSDAPRLSDYDTSHDYHGDYRRLGASRERDIHDEIAGHETEVLQALGIYAQRKGHQRCPLGTHEDRRPSWRWDVGKRRWFCSCGHGTVIDAVMTVQNVDAGEAIRWIRKLLDGDAPPARRVAPKPPPLERPTEETHEAVAAEAMRRWAAACPADPRHPYLRRKNVQPHGLRQEGGRLLVPLQDIDARLWSVQTIAPDGFKMFPKGGRAGGLFSPLGLAGVPEQLIICEGRSTGATLHEETGWPVLCAMNANNLLPVAKAAREAWPEAAITIAADNDAHTAGNPGLTRATLAALAVGGRLAVPAFPENADRKDSDFNDLRRLTPGAVKATIEAADTKRL